ncbi:uncharacterized protein LAJ45_02124 [Morchella importuna]|uniref:Uncharacterized protein n=1 Tax=Morchella conica CCBAS932 TaxID=1392247 RepID=A0A3N4L8X5_9PEZI|nr:uncharacterized protein LAJ45_02124 [Morchella importuna]KAH8154356.1 hypothetical protein LAJ45_02124 [Morchella importuna]RPB17081.1 hypothetical protein P167DRAFT_541806 [Morchella conica CCBAS932]
MPLKHRLFKLSKFTSSLPSTYFETLPPEIILELILSLPSFGDLNALISASPHTLRIFNAYTTTILNRLSRNIIGPEAWHDNVVVLICQRHDLPVAEPNRLIKDLTSQFAFNRADIPHMASNERVYRACSKQLKAATESAPSFLDAPFAFRNRPDGAAPLQISLRNTPGCPRGGVLPRRMFYRVWVYCVATKFENVGFPVEYLSCAQRIELRLVQYLMKPREVKRIINYELMEGFKGRRPPRLKRLVEAVKPHAERAWERVLGLPREAVEGWEEFKALGKRGLWHIIENL